MEKPSSSTELNVSGGPGGETLSTPEDTGEAPQPEGKVQIHPGILPEKSTAQRLPLVTRPPLVKDTVGHEGAKCHHHPGRGRGFLLSPRLGSLASGDGAALGSQGLWPS